MMSLATLWPYALAAVLLLAAVIVVLLVLVLRKSAKVSQFSDAAEPEESEEGEAKTEARAGIADHVMITAAFRRARTLIRALSDRDQYRAALHLMIGAEGSREPGFLGRMTGSGLQLAYDDPVREGLAFGDGCGFYFFDDGVVLDLAGQQVLGADGVSSDTRGWRTILRQLRELRPKRPADGVILTVSAVDLLEARKVESRLAARADRLHRKLWEVQQQLGFRLPVYVVVTGCENLAGFSDLCISLPQSSRGEMIGWSSPHAVHVPYNPAWLDDAFEDLHRDLGNMQMELFAGGERPKGVLLFPWSMRSLKKPLRTFLNHLFKSSAYHEGMMVRGFYFCGTSAGDTMFAADLLEHKIFPETGLAVPTSRTKMARDRRVRVLQTATAGAAILFAAGLTWAWLSFRHENKVLKPVLEAALRAKMQKSVTNTDAEVEIANDILDGMAKINFRRYGSVFVPSSWFSSFDDELRGALVTTFNTVILDSIQTRLERKVDAAMNGATMRIVPEGAVDSGRRGIAFRTATDAILPVEETPEFQSLQRFVSALQQIEVHGRMLNELAKENRGELRALGQLIEFSFGHPLSDRFFKNGELYETALKTAHSTRNFDPERYRAHTSETARVLAEDLYHRLYDRNPFAARLGALEASLNSGRQAGETSAEDFKYLAQTMHSLEDNLAGPELQWAFKPGFDLGPSYNEMLAAMGRSGFFGPECVTVIRTRGSSGWSSFNRRLLAETPFTGPILATRNGSPEMKLSTNTLLLRSAVEAFLNQGFVSARGATQNLVTTLRPEERLVWNPGLLRQAVTEYQAYERFRDKGLKLFSPELQAAVDVAARDRVGVQMQDLLVAAQTIEPAPSAPTNAVLESELQNGVDRFASAAKLVDENLDVFARLDLYKPRTDLIAVMNAEAMRLLRMTDELFQRNAPYTAANDLGWRDGSTPPSPAAWGARDPAELSLFLETTRGRMSHLARTYAKPMLAWMADAGTDDLPENIEVVNRWQSILDDLDDFDAKKPANATAALEDYLSNAMAKVTTKDCSTAVLTARPQRRNGYLATRLEQLSRQVTEICWTQSSQEAIRRYVKIAGYFNERLAGRYPFASASPTSTTIEADPDDIRRFYRLFDDSDALIRSIPPDRNDGLHGAREFLDDMRTVRVFFAGFLDPVKATRNPEVDIETEFRTLQQREMAGNEIIRWSLSIGDETVTERDKAKKLRWTPGTPVRVELRWANDAPHVPVLSAARRGVSVADRVVTYEYKNQWALLYALSDLRAAAADLGPEINAPPVTLALTVQTKPADGATALPRSAQVFMRVALLTPEGTPLDVPAFPAKAPALEGFIIGDIR